MKLSHLECTALPISITSKQCYTWESAKFPDSVACEAKPFHCWTSLKPKFNLCEDLVLKSIQRNKTLRLNKIGFPEYTGEILYSLECLTVLLMYPTVGGGGGTFQEIVVLWKSMMFFLWKIPSWTICFMESAIGAMEMSTPCTVWWFCRLNVSRNKIILLWIWNERISTYRYWIMESF